MLRCDQIRHRRSRVGRFGKQLAKAVVNAVGEHQELNDNNSEQIVQKYCDDFVKGFISVSKKI